MSLSGEPVGGYQPIETVWIRSDPATGQVTAELYLGSLSSMMAATTDPGMTVHGLPAGLRQEGRQWILTWDEAGRSVMARGTDVTSELLAFAESSEVDGSGARATAPTGFTVVEREGAVGPDAANLSASYLPTDGSAGGVHVVIRPNVAGQATEQLYFELGSMPDTTATIQEFRGRDYVVGTGTVVPFASGTAQPFVEWAQADAQFILSGTLTRDELLDIAADMRVATEAQVRDLGRSITVRIDAYQYTPGIRLGPTSIKPAWYVGDWFLSY